ncbi:hypothetical protein A6X21_07990 [Planctopirus hydrillae]|uniref:Uncharacterized protein n=2 Tax=Planctopirus hydrillae TaxID=1841610 RepID=A0A1C3E8L2_9PLAN|nr:hypothetical protein A6X21_07990 [Planctopirus hydrillae]
MELCENNLQEPSSSDGKIVQSRPIIPMCFIYSKAVPQQNVEPDRVAETIHLMMDKEGELHPRMVVASPGDVIECDIRQRDSNIVFSLDGENIEREVPGLLVSSGQDGERVWRTRPIRRAEQSGVPIRISDMTKTPQRLTDRRGWIFVQNHPYCVVGKHESMIYVPPEIWNSESLSVMAWHEQQGHVCRISVNGTQLSMPVLWKDVKSLVDSKRSLEPALNVLTVIVMPNN